MMLGSVLVALVSVWLGLTLSYHLGTAASATMAVVPVVFFFLTLTITRVLQGRRVVAGERELAGAAT
jgi:manganese/iron transport system permease protein